MSDKEKEIRKRNSTASTLSSNTTTTTTTTTTVSTTSDNNNNNNKIRLTWIGHSTCWVEMADYTLLTDPMFSHRASPVQFWPFGVGRTVDPPVPYQSPGNLPSPIDVCLLSHDHYDHLDLESCRALRHKVKLWVVPLGIKEWLIQNCNVPAQKIVELQWWESVTRVDDDHSSTTTTGGVVAAVGRDGHHRHHRRRPRAPLTLTCAPAQHWGGRTFWDRNTRLWCSWAVQSADRSFYFGGDTGLPEEFPLFQQIGDRLGPFDLAALPIGAYKPRFFMRDSHVNPREAVQIHRQLSCRKSVAIHWGTFPLAEEQDHEPPKLLREAIEEVEKEEGVVVDFVAIQPGETVETTTRTPVASAVVDVVDDEEEDVLVVEDDDDDDDDESNAAMSPPSTASARQIKQGVVATTPPNLMGKKKKKKYNNNDDGESEAYGGERGQYMSN
jgi:L-ascorbate metabolism protein UlaG (beta-lactamase superfamily)